MLRYEFSEGSSNKFWEIALVGKKFTTTYGRIGSPGQSTTKALPSEEKAKQEYEKLIAEKERKGYRLVSNKKGKGTPAERSRPKDDDDAQLKQRLFESAVTWSTRYRDVKPPGSPKDVTKLSLIGNSSWMNLPKVDRLEPLLEFKNLQFMDVGDIAIVDAIAIASHPSLEEVLFYGGVSCTNWEPFFSSKKLKTLTLTLESPLLPKFCKMLRPEMTLRLQDVDAEQDFEPLWRIWKEGSLQICLDDQKTCYSLNKSRVTTAQKAPEVHEWSAAETQESIPARSGEHAVRIFRALLEKRDEYPVDRNVKRASSPDTFKKKYREIRKLESPTSSIKKCLWPNRKDSPYHGSFWTTGFHLNKAQPTQVTDWAALDEANEIAYQLREMLRESVHSSSIDEPYFPFVLTAKVPDGEPFLSAFVRALGAQSAPKQGDCEIRIPKKDDDLFFNLRSMGTGEKLTDYLSKKDVQLYRQAAQRMKKNLSNVREVGMPWGFTHYPVFWIGRTKTGLWTGVFSVRADL